jgi:hypothetical protein
MICFTYSFIDLCELRELIRTYQETPEDNLSHQITEVLNNELTQTLHVVSKLQGYFFYIEQTIVHLFKL